eukprot:78281_1
MNVFLKYIYHIINDCNGMGILIAIADNYTNIAVAIDFVYQKNVYWAVTLFIIIAFSNVLITYEAITAMKPKSFLTASYVTTLCMFGFGPIILLRHLLPVEDDKDSFSQSHSKIEKSMSDTCRYNYIGKIISIRSYSIKIQTIKSFSESMLSFSLQSTYLIITNQDPAIYNKNWLLIISISISIISYGSGLTKWIQHYGRRSVWPWYHDILGIIYFGSDLSMRIVSFVLFYIWSIDTNNLTDFFISVTVWVILEILCCRIATHIWNIKYKINDNLMNPNRFLGGLLYCITCLFTSYYYTSQLPFNYFCG